MRELFIVGQSFGREAQSKCMKVYRKQDKKELSFCFDNSLGAFGDELGRIEACIFADADSLSNKAEVVYHVNGAEDFALCILKFVKGDI